MKNFIILFSLAAVLGLFSCTNKSDDVNPQPAQSSIIFSFNHFVGSQIADFNSIKYTNAYGNMYSIETLKYFVSDIALYTSDGGIVLIDDEHYVDARDESTWVFDPEIKISTGEYIAVSFIFGLNEEKNISGSYTNPPESNMEWPMAMGGGYHYMKLEGKHDSAGVTKNYQAHTGATMGNQNYIRVSLPNSGFIATGAGVQIAFKMNINNWWVSPNTLDLNEITSIMGNQPMQVKLHDNGKEDVFSIYSIE